MSLTEGSEHTTAQPVHQQQVSGQLQTKLGNKCSHWALGVHWWGEGEKVLPRSTYISSTHTTAPCILFQNKNLHIFSFTARYMKDGPQNKQTKKQSLHLLNKWHSQGLEFVVGICFCLFFYPYDFQGLKSLMQFKSFANRRFSTEITWTSWKGSREGRKSSKEEMPSWNHWFLCHVYKEPKNTASQVQNEYSPTVHLNLWQ